MKEALDRLRSVTAQIRKSKSLDAAEAQGQLTMLFGAIQGILSQVDPLILSVEKAAQKRAELATEAILDTKRSVENAVKLTEAEASQAVQDAKESMLDVQAQIRDRIIASLKDDLGGVRTQVQDAFEALEKGQTQSQTKLLEGLTKNSGEVEVTKGQVAKLIKALDSKTSESIKAAAQNAESLIEGLRVGEFASKSEVTRFVKLLTEKIDALSDLHQTVAGLALEGDRKTAEEIEKKIREILKTQKKNITTFPQSIDGFDTHAIHFNGHNEFNRVQQKVTPVATDRVLGEDSADNWRKVWFDVDDFGGGAVEGTAVLSTGEAGGSKFLREDGDGTSSWVAIPGGGDALTASPLSQFAATTSAQLLGVISDPTGTGKAVFGTSPTITTPAISGNLTTTGTIDGRDVATDGTKLDGIEASADVTDTANVTSAGALMDSEVDANIKTLVLPASTTISAFGATVIDDANAAAARTTLDVDQAGTQNSTDVTLVGTGTYLSLAGQAITVDPITESDITDLGTYLTDITGEALSTLSDVTISAIADNEVLRWNGSAWINNTLAELGVDPTGTDNSTDVTLAGVPNYLTISGQEITLGTVDIGDDTNLAAGTGLTLTGDSLSVDASQTQVTAVGTIDTGVWNGTAIEGSAIASTGEAGGTKFLREDGDGTCSWQTVSGSGDVVGPASATDNAVVRYDSTTGKLVQDSVVTIDDTTGKITWPGDLQSTKANTIFTTNGDLTFAQGANQIHLDYQFAGSGVGAEHRIGTSANYITRISPATHTVDTNAAQGTTVSGGNALPSAVTNLDGGPVIIKGGDGASGSAGDADGGSVTISGGTAYGTGTEGTVTIDTIVDMSTATSVSLPTGTVEGTAVASTGEGGGTKYLREDGDGTCSWQTPAGSGDVSKVGTPVNDQVGVWTGDGTIEGTTGLTYDGSTLGLTGNITVSGTVDGRDIATDGTKLDGVETGADVTDTANVTSAGALMDSEVDADIKTLVLPASTTISAYGATVIDDANAAAARTTLGLVIGTDVQPAGATVSYNEQTGTTYTLVAGDKGQIVKTTNGAAVTITTGSSAVHAANDVIHILQAGAGQVSIAAGSGVTINKSASFNANTHSQYSQVTLEFESNTVAYLVGMLEAV